MVVEQRGGWQTGHIEPARANASPSRSTAKGDEKVSHKTYTQEEYKYLIRYTLGLSKPTDNVGQHAKNNGEVDLSQFGHMKIACFIFLYIYWLIRKRGKYNKPSEKSIS